MHMHVDWTALEAIFTGSTLVVLILAGLYTVFQLREMVRSRTLEALNQIHSELHSRQAKRDRGNLFRSRLDEMLPEEFRDLSEDERGFVERVADSWQHVGIVARYRLIRRDILFEYFGAVLLLSYKKLKSYIRDTQTRRGPVYAKHVVWLAKECEKHFKRTYGELEFQRVFGVTTLVGD